MINIHAMISINWLYLIFYSSVALILYTLYCYWKWSVHFKKLNGITGPKKVPFIGTLGFFTNNSKVFLKEMHQLHELYGDTVRMCFKSFTWLQTKDYGLIEYVLSSNQIIDKAEPYKYLLNWLGTGLLTSTGPKWKKHRKLITPAYHFNILEQFIETFDNMGNIFIEKLKQKCDKGVAEVDVYPMVTLLTLDIICETAMGTSINAQQVTDSLYVRSVKEMCSIIIHKSFSMLQIFDPLFYLSSYNWTERKCLKVLHSHTDNVIQERRKTVQNANNYNNVNDDDVGRKKRVAFLDLLLQSTVDGRPLTDVEIREEVDTFMFEGHDTTASAISFALYCLANNPDVQRKAFEEQIEIFGSEPHRKTTLRDLQDMKYLEMVIKETLRMYPSVPFYGRKVTEECTYGDMTLSKNMNITIFSYAIQYDPKYFKDPHNFDPERFSPANNEGKYPFSFIAFSAGPRNCIGQKFAMLEMKSTLGKVLRNFELTSTSPPHKLELVAETILKSTNGVLVNVKKRAY